MTRFTFVQLLLLCASAVAAPTTRPSTPIPPNQCATTECHREVKQFAVVHAPVSSNTCDGCHESLDAKAHTFRLLREKAELCTHCHEFSTEGLPTVHKPVADGDCLGCHDPHGGNSHAIVREESTVELCGRCHESITKNMSFLHGPVKQGDCTSCHTPHMSQFPKLVDLTGADLCLTCHVELGPRIANSQFKHDALKEGCEKCHDVHGSNESLSLHKSPPGLCFDCHQKLSDQISAAAVKHSVVTSDRACSECHDPHASNFARLMNASPAQVCLNCHDKPIEQNNVKVAAVPEIADPNYTKHGELKDGQCGGCHAVHGGANESLLVKRYSRAFYQSFSIDNYELCFSCHEPGLVRDAETGTATGFRDGGRNLHFLHANLGSRDKNCRACHLTHAGANPRLVRDRIRYGKWEMPVGFNKTENGGSCLPGCHPYTAYDRDHPVAPTTAPATQHNGNGLVRAQHREGTVVSWYVADADGHEVKMPDGKRPAVILLVRAADAVRTIDTVGEAVSKSAVQFATVIVGEDALESLKNLSQPSGRSIILDPQNDTALALDVHALPILLAFRSDGTEVARIPAAHVPTAVIKLRSYVDQLTSASTRPASHPATFPAELRDRERKTTRALHTIQRFLAENDAKAALNAIEHAADVVPPDELVLLRAEALLQLNQAPDVIALLERRQFAEQDMRRSLVLQARAWIALADAGYARRLLEDAVSRGLKSPEIYLALGDACAAMDKWKPAAEYYRLAIATPPR